MDMTASSGSGGRPMLSYTWELFDFTVEDESDTQFMLEVIELVSMASGDGASGTLVLPHTSRQWQGRVSWRFNVSATNWQGATGWDSFQVSDILCCT